MAALAKHRPYMASVLDLERPEQLDEVLDWTEEAAQFVEVVMIIPKAHGIISHLPRTIGGKSVRLGFSIPTKHGGTAVSPAEFCGWSAHLLGGSPHAQMKWSKYFDTRSADGNYSQKMALQYSRFWTPGTATFAKNRWWPRLDEAGESVTNNAPYEAFRRSCQNIMAAWRRD